MLSLSRVQAYGLVSTTVFVSTVINAFRQRSNFYAAAVYLSKSNACMMVSTQHVLLRSGCRTGEGVTSVDQRVSSYLSRRFCGTRPSIRRSYSANCCRSSSSENSA